jgi:hypothetical protein
MRDGEVVDGLVLGRLDERLYEYRGELGAPVEEAGAVAGMLAEAEGAAAGRGKGRVSSAFREAVGSLTPAVKEDESPFGDLIVSERRAQDAGPEPVSESVPVDGEAGRRGLVALGRRFSSVSREAIGKGFTSDEFVADLRRLLRDVEAAVAAGRPALAESARDGSRARRRRRPFGRDEFADLLGPLKRKKR